MEQHKNESLLRVMYAPFDYVHPQRFIKPAGFLSAGVQQALNHHLIKQYQLPTALDFAVETANFSQRLIKDWKLLPTVAWLLGCKIVRGSLAIGGRLAALPEIAQRFVVLPVPCPAYPSTFSTGGTLSKSEIELVGARYLRQLQAQLPAALAQRLALVFSPEADNDVDQSIPDWSLNRSLLTFAFDYAQNSSD
jgi:type III secretion system OrgA/MxiK family protein